MLFQRQSKAEDEDRHVKVWSIITVSRNCDATGMENSLFFWDVKLRRLCNIPEEEGEEGGGGLAGEAGEGGGEEGEEEEVEGEEGEWEGGEEEEE
jgi:hypothetical protein